MTKARRRGRDPRPVSRERALFTAALGMPVDSPEVRAVVEALGTTHVARRFDEGYSRYDPDVARAEAWDFPDAPPANRWSPTFLAVRDGVVVWLNLAPSLVGETGERSVVIRPPDDVPFYAPWGDEWHWAPRIVRRGDRFLLHLDVPQGHWDGTYKFPLTESQVARLQADDLLYREVWEGLVRICQSRRFFENPATLPGDAQALLDARCGPD